MGRQSNAVATILASLAHTTTTTTTTTRRVGGTLTSISRAFTSVQQQQQQQQQQQHNCPTIQQQTIQERRRHVQLYGHVTTPATSATTTRRLFASSSTIPEPGACPKCSDDGTYWDGSTLFVCTACAHEWSAVLATEDDNDSASNNIDDDNLTRDSNGAILEQGDSCVLIKDLAKGKLKKGLKVKIRLGDYGDGHDCEATIPYIGTYALKSAFLKKV